MSCSASIPHSPHPTRPARGKTAFCKIVGGLNDAALDYMREHALAGTLVHRLATHEQRRFAGKTAWMGHLEQLGLTGLQVTPDPVRVATEGALWGAVSAHGFLCEAVVLSDDAGQFNVGQHALCRVGGDVTIPTPHSPGRALE